VIKFMVYFVLFKDKLLRGDDGMSNDLNYFLQADPEAQKYYLSQPKYVQEAINKHVTEINNADALHLFVETFLQDDSYRGA